MADLTPEFFYKNFSLCVVPDALRITYAGNYGYISQVNALTITSRKYYTSPEEFRTDFYEFCQAKGIKSSIDGVMEIHPHTKNKIHAHAFIYSKALPKGNSSDNNFHFDIRPLKELNDVAKWYNYMMKDVLATLEILYKDPKELRARRSPPVCQICLFDD